MPLEISQKIILCLLKFRPMLFYKTIFNFQAAGIPTKPFFSTPSLSLQHVSIALGYFDEISPEIKDNRLQSVKRAFTV
jgi:hypothetical protein